MVITVKKRDLGGSAQDATYLFISSMKIRSFAVWTLQPLSLDAGFYSCVQHAGHARQSTLGSLCDDLPTA